MKKRSVSLKILAVGIVSLSIIACKEIKKDPIHENAINELSSKSGTIVDGYLKLKDALVGDNQENAAKAGEVLIKSLSDFDLGTIEASKQDALKTILATIKENSLQIAKSDIGQQRQHFENLSADLVDFVAIVGTSFPLYQQFCPMYNNNKGGMWVSNVKTVKNPYFGSAMLNCGVVQKEIN